MRRSALLSLAAILAGLPVAFAATLALLPLWRWVEDATGREAVGHSGPAAWCFWTVYACWLLVAACIVRRMRPAGA